jgi:hypothetical protein
MEVSRSPGTRRTILTGSSGSSSMKDKPVKTHTTAKNNACSISELASPTPDRRMGD